jgi:hypothetical protein
VTYVQKEDLKKSLELTGTTYADRDIERAIPAACAAIDSLCHRSFEQDAVAVQRFYRAQTRTLCPINDVGLPADDLTTDEPLAVVAIDRAATGAWDEAWTEGVDYQLEPLNATVDGKPYEVIRALRAQFPAHSGAVSVTARFGWTAVPPEVVEAAVLLANRLIIRIRQAPLGVVTAGADVGVAMRIARTDPDLALLLDDLTREVYF